MPDKENFNAVVGSTVRRLTPLECERLQGFPDHWTLIGESEVLTKSIPQADENDHLLVETDEDYKVAYGKDRVYRDQDVTEYFYTDTTGKRKKCSDSARYKALGNSIALPFWEWLAKRIIAVYNRPITMGSLFDGIGGFPLVFERNGAKAVWASEIEEFPIAVTKRRFPE